MVNKKAFILGVLGQDGSYLAELLFSQGYQIYGLVKENASPLKIEWIQNLIPNICILPIDVLNKQAIFQAIQDIQPDEIYNFAGISNVFNAWENPELVFSINCNIPFNILDTISKIDPSIRFFQASSSLIFGRDTSGFQDEQTKTNPIYPYGISKLFADNLVKEYRRHFEMFVCSGILFPHESPRRGEQFFSKKVMRTVKQIKNKRQEKLILGDLSIFRDYGYAPDFMQAVFLMMQNEEPKDYVIGTGRLTSLREFVEKSFAFYGMNYLEYVDIDLSVSRKDDINILRANISKIKNDLNWQPEHSLDDMIRIMMENMESKE